MLSDKGFYLQLSHLLLIKHSTSFSNLILSLPTTLTRTFDPHKWYFSLNCVLGRRLSRRMFYRISLRNWCWFKIWIYARSFFFLDQFLFASCTLSLPFELLIYLRRNGKGWLFNFEGGLSVFFKTYFAENLNGRGLAFGIIYTQSHAFSELFFWRDDSNKLLVFTNTFGKSWRHVLLLNWRFSAFKCTFRPVFRATGLRFAHKIL